MRRRAIAGLLMMTAATWTSVAAAQSTPGGANAGVDSSGADHAPEVAFKPSEVRVEVSVPARRLWVIAGNDTLRSTTVSVASGHELTYAGRRWRFATPRGTLRVLRKRTDPVWLPPDWHYAEVAQAHGLRLRRLTKAGARLEDGRRITFRDSIAGVSMPGDTTFLALPLDEHLVFDSTLFIPPVGTHNRRLRGELGKYALDLGNGYLLHGTTDQRSIGTATTHGCIRLPDEELEWLFRHIPVGARVRVR
jgi:hypothetical protein